MEISFLLNSSYGIYHETTMEVSAVPRAGEVVEIIFSDYEYHDTFTVKNVVHIPRFNRIEIELVIKLKP